VQLPRRGGAHRQATDYDRLVLEVWTNGTVSPPDAVGLAATLLRDHLTIFVNAESETALEGARRRAPPRTSRST
jgi:DNA-directed RNA polymerase subunit alpha